MFFIIFFTLIFGFFSLSLSYFKFFIFGFFLIQYPINRLFEGHVFAMSANHLPQHDHIPFIGNYFFIPIRNAVNPATPIIIQLTVTYILYNIKNILLLQKSFSLPKRERDNKMGTLGKTVSFMALLQSDIYKRLNPP